MSEKLTGNIEDKQTKEGNTNNKNWKRFVFVVAGKKLSSFDTKMEEFKVGELVNVEYDIDGNYNNLKSMVRATQVPEVPQDSVPTQSPVQTPTAPPIPTAAPAKQVGQNFYESKKETEASIVSQVILKVVGNMVSEGRIEPGAFKSNTTVLVETYKTIKKQLLE